jgi:hypothetical protein
MVMINFCLVICDHASFHLINRFPNYADLDLQHSAISRIHVVRSQ